MSEMNAHRSQRSLLIATATIGFGLGGFFDGILLHQVLQWHHLLSLVPGEALRDLGAQILADGLFHVLMYVITAVGLWLLFRRRAALANEDWRHIAGGVVLGFAAWNLVDIGIFHWALGIHRIRVGVPYPMLYDLGWLVTFGLVPLALAWWLFKRSRPNQNGGPAAAAVVTILAVLAAPLAARPQPNSNSALVLFAPGTSTAAAVNAVMQADVRLLWVDPNRSMIIVALDHPRVFLELYRHGAVFVSRSPALIGCAAALRA
jgi:uncharacterized membrane protein